ncbi:MAG: bifunctional UDP-N-acetylmuramoyl-tripeptide:D-alanyl-D-alanine ligase/alanine racemase [Sphingobacteriales bacterium]|nr:MAG: bifunctional UDP-N-acetylmuramoyl-tripeptide:D-alanyl-D-alanine ligase/alanine racemase [Sphingobacteriales bacterium]
MDSIIYTIQKIADLIGERAIIKNPNQNIQHLLFDSRKLADAPTSLFFVLPGKVNGHLFIANLYQLGFRSFVIWDNNFNLSNFTEANFIYSQNTLNALQELATQHRKNFSFPVIGITGSNGKTMVKEWLFQLLNNSYKIVRSPKSFNSQLGVPLSVWQMSNDYNLGIFEAGISKPNEMQNLQKIIQPTIGILTNIGTAHDEGFTNTAQKITEKFNLFSIAKFVILNVEYLQYINNDNTKIFTWSFTTSADLQITNTLINSSSTTITALYLQKQICITIPFTDKAAIENAITCWASLLLLNINQQTIAQNMLLLQPVKMRLELKAGKNNCSIIDDSYNSDLSSLEIALDFLNQQQQHPKKVLILSDLRQTGIPPQILYQKVAQLLTTKNIQTFIGVGEDIKFYQNYFAPNSQFFANTQNLIAHLEQINFSNKAILLKGARDFKFEKVSKLLTQKVHETVLEINLNALENNLNYYKSLLNPSVRVMAIVKAFSYGTGSYQIANVLQYNKIDYLAVAFADEGTELRKAGITTPIMVMSPEVSAFDAIIDNNLEPELYSFRILKAFADYLAYKNIDSYSVHLKLDTGMHRLGFEGKEITELANYLKVNTHLAAKSVFSHLVASEDVLQDDFTQQQIDDFTAYTTTIEQSLGYFFIKHLANTSAISRFKNAQFDMVRLGIGFYGVDAANRSNNSLENVLTLKTTISQIKYLKKGDTVGYNRRGIMPVNGKIATLKIGYADGISRNLGNGKGTMLVNNIIAPTIGSICMDMCMLDITNIDCNEGDEVIIFADRQTIFNLADTLKTIPYEILTNISARVKRVYYYA